MLNKNGFLLMECCVYLMICAILTVTIMRWLTQTALQAGHTMQATDRTMLVNLAHDVLVRDLYAAPTNYSAWLAITADHIIWQSAEGKTIGWYKNNNQLIRKEGNYNAALKQWGKHHASAVAYGVSTFSNQTYKEADVISGIVTTLCLEDGLPSVRYTRIRNGRFSCR